MNQTTTPLSSRLPIHNVTLFSFLLLSIALSAADGLLTLGYLDRGIAREANPIMDFFIRHDPALFFAVKMALTVLGLLLCYGHLHLRVGRIGLKLAGFVYLALSAYHAYITANY